MARWIDRVRGHEDNWRRLSEMLGKGTLPHAMAFVGPSGLGKKRMAFALAQAGLCATEAAPCGACAACLRIDKLQSEALLILAPSGGSLKLDQAHEVLRFLQLRAISSRRFIVIDDAGLMNPSFANALLKILEEPPDNTHFIFLATTLSQLLPTLRSRLQTVRFFPLPDAVIAEISQASEWMVRAAGGSFASLEEWNGEEVAGMKAKAVTALTDLAGGRRAGLEALLPVIKEREAAELTAKLFQQFFRDAVHLRSGLGGLVHADAHSSLNAWASNSQSHLMRMWHESFRLQQDIAANLDRTLSFENFFCRGRRLMEDADAVLD